MTYDEIEKRFPLAIDYMLKRYGNSCEKKGLGCLSLLPHGSKTT